MCEYFLLLSRCVLMHVFLCGTAQSAVSPSHSCFYHAQCCSRPLLIRQGPLSRFAKCLKLVTTVKCITPYDEGALTLELPGFDTLQAYHGQGNNTLAIKFTSPTDAKRFRYVVSVFCINLLWMCVIAPSHNHACILAPSLIV